MIDCERVFHKKELCSKIKNVDRSLNNDKVINFINIFQ